MMKNNTNLEWVGQRFGQMTVLEIVRNKNGVISWNMRCDCGKETICQPSIIRGLKKQTRCITCAVRQTHDKKSPEIGTKFGNLTLIGRFSGKLWICKCDCGGSVERSISHIKRAKFSGCLKCLPDRMGPDHKFQDHNTVNSKLYRLWSGMKRRCSSNLPQYSLWNGKGIKVCDEWQDSANFIKWSIVNGYADGLSLDRIDSNLNYEPSNCEWVTRSENSKRVTSKRDEKIAALQNRIKELETQNIDWNRMVTAMVG